MENSNQQTRTVVSVINSWESLPLLLTTEEASSVLGYSSVRIREMCNAGKLPFIREGRHFRIPKETLHSWILDTSKRNICGEQDGRLGRIS